jgi:signal transduction histidine kinase
MELKGDIDIKNSVKDLSVFSDREGFERMLDNLLSNAIKYNKREGFVKFYTKDKTLFIEDSGRGIETKDLFTVFDKAYQENPTTEGFGLGLSIVKKFCDREKIDIKIESKLDIGTTFMLDLKRVLIVT